MFTPGLNYSLCHLGLLGGIRAALPASWKNKHATDELLQVQTHIYPSPNTYIVCLSGGQEKFMCLLTLSHCLLITLQCLDNVQNHRRLYKREWPWITSGMFAGIRKVRLSLGAIWIHTSWVCGSGDGTAEGFGFTGGIGGFGFMILESRCSHFKQEKMAGPIKHVNPNITFFFVIYRFCCKWWQRSGWR